MNEKEYKELLKIVMYQNQIITYLIKIVFNLASQSHNYNLELANLVGEASQYAEKYREEVSDTKNNS